MQPFYVRKRLEMELIAHLTKKSSIDFLLIACSAAN